MQVQEQTPSWILRCHRRTLFNENVSSQILQTNSLAPVCLTMCLARSHSLLKVIPLTVYGEFGAFFWLHCLFCFAGSLSSFTFDSYFVFKSSVIFICFTSGSYLTSPCSGLCPSSSSDSRFRNYFVLQGFIFIIIFIFSLSSSSPS